MASPTGVALSPAIANMLSGAGKQELTKKIVKWALIASAIVLIVGIIIAAHGGVVGNGTTIGYGLGWLTFGGVGMLSAGLLHRYFKKEEERQLAAIQLPAKQ